MQALTTRELDCLRWVALGKTSWEIGVIMGLTERTINFHMGRVCHKLGVYRRQAAVTVALQTGLLPLREGPPSQSADEKPGGPPPGPPNTIHANGDCLATGEQA